MSFQSVMMNVMAARSDKKRDAQIPLPEGVVQCRNISYGPQGKWNLLDVYYPEGTAQPLPTIVSIHGGGYVYGNKEIYRRYCMELARQGFSVVNFNYRLAPRWKFPTPLYDTNAVMQWITANAQRYHLDPGRILLVGDSAGAQLASQYAAIGSNGAYADLFDMKPAPVTIRAVALNCGLYDVDSWLVPPRKGLAADYLGKEISREDPRLKVLDSIDENYPPAYITTCHNDFLKDNAQPMWQHLTDRGVVSGWKCYGTPENKEVAHVFHINIRLPEAKQCNADTIEFFRQHL